MVIGTHAPVACSCGNRDCWEAFSSERAAMARYAKLAGKNIAAPFGFRELVDAALWGEADAKAALVDTALCLGVGISNLVVASVRRLLSSVEK
jgi:predicted NBD/HSP70 family sugar kinase